MDKFEMNLKMEQIKKLAAKKAYKEAAEIANEINWVKVKDWSILATVINVQEAVGDYEEARDAAIIAYNRNLGGKKLVYKLTQLLIKLKQFDEADELYDEYDKMAYRDADRYVLFYELRKAEGAEDTELISILEEYKEQEADEKYLYELAKLYAKHDRKEDCIQLCDDIIMWFQDGEYVENSIKLKEKLGGSLTKLQQKIKTEAQKRKNDTEETKEILFEKQKEMMRLKDNELDEVLEEDELVDIEEEDEESDGLQVPPMFSQSDDISITSVMEALMGDDESDDESDVEEAVEKKTFGKTAAEPDVQDADEDEDEELIDPTDDEDDFDMEDEVEDEEESDEPDIEEKMNQIPENIQSMIEDAKRQIDDKYEKFNQEEEAAELEREKQQTLRAMRAREDAMAESVSVPSFKNNIYDTQNIQEALAKNFSEIIDDDEDELEGLRPSPKKVEEPKAVVVQQADEVEADEQIEGQMNLAEWLENVREEKYGKQNTKQYSRSEVVRFLEDRDEKSAAYDKLIEEQKANKVAELAAQSKKEAEAAHKAKEQMMLHAAKTDLAIRTGKATLKLEESVASMKSEAAAAKEQSEKLVEQQVEQVVETVDVDSVVTQDSIAEDELIATTEIPRKIKLSTATFEPVTDEVIDAHNKATKHDVESEKEIEDDAEDAIDNVIAGLVAREIAEREESAEKAASDSETQEAFDEESEEVKQEAEEANVENEQSIEGESDDATAKPVKKKISKIKLNNPVLRGHVVVRDGEKRLTGDLAKLFRKYREMPGIEAQLIDFFENIDEEINTSTSKTGNLIISGNSSSDKIDLARTIVRAINFLYPDKAKKIAKTTGDSINSRGIEKAMPKLMGTALIVEDAGAIQPKRIKEMLACLSQDTGGMIAIFEDSDAEMNVLINFNPDLVNSFNHRIVLKQYTVNELVELARKYANKKQYEIDEDALLELYLKIDALHNAMESIRLDDVKEIINKAIEKAVERGSKKKFVLMKRTTTKSGMNYLLAQDFKD